MTIIYKLNDLVEANWDAKQLADAILLESTPLADNGRWLVEVVAFNRFSGRHEVSTNILCTDPHKLAEAIEPLWQFVCAADTHPMYGRLSLNVLYKAACPDKPRETCFRKEISVQSYFSYGVERYYIDNQKHKVRTIRKEEHKE